MKLARLIGGLHTVAVISGVSVNPILAEPQRINVDWLDVQWAAETWQCIIRVQKQLFRLVLQEVGQFDYSANLGTIVTTTGSSFSLSNGIWTETGPARLAILRSDIEGLRVQGGFHLGTEMWHLVPSQAPRKRGFRSSKPTYHIWQEPERIISVPNAHTGESSSIGAHSLMKRDNKNAPQWPTDESLRASIGDDKCFTELTVAPIAIAADANYLSAFNTIPEAYLHLVDTVNKASQIWEVAFNVTLSLSKVVSAHDGMQYPWNWRCDSTDNYLDSLKSRLSALSDWRETNGEDGFALWSLFTSCPSGDVVGLAWQESACTAGGANIVHHTVLDYRILAHEIGHVFGAVHDCTNMTCGSDTVCCPYSPSQCDAGGQFIMNPGSNAEQFVFSKCTRGNVCSGIRDGRVNTSCLVPRKTVPQIQSQCSSLGDAPAYERCWHDLQCMDYTNATASRSCGDQDACTLHCQDSVTQECHNYGIILLEGTPCGDPLGKRGVCTRGQCNFHHKVSTPNWIKGLIALAAVVSGAALVAICGFFAARWYRARQRTMPAEYSPAVIGGPRLVKRVITPAPIGVLHQIPSSYLSYAHDDHYKHQPGHMADDSATTFSTASSSSCYSEKTEHYAE